MKIKEVLCKNMKWIVSFICLAIFLLIFENVLDKEIIEFDNWGYNLISSNLINEKVTPIAKKITFLGGPIFILSLVIIISIFIKNRRNSFLIWLNLFVSSGLNQCFKYIIQRPRPIDIRIIEESGYSFPSGHSMVGMAVYGYFIYLVNKNIENKYLKYGLMILLSILILLIGVSRIYLGVHYTSDVIAGFMISISYLILFTHLTLEKK